MPQLPLAVSLAIVQVGFAMILSGVGHVSSAKTEVCDRDQKYLVLVADPRRPVAPGDEYWNRDMFRLIGDLTSEVTVDISKFPLPEILQLHTD
jgi:hypothetical protein